MKKVVHPKLVKKYHILPTAAKVCNKGKEIQFKIIHGFLATNVLLYKMNIANSSQCNFCCLYDQNLYHMLYDCIEVKNFWFGLNEWLVRSHGKRLTLSLQNIVLGDLNAPMISNKLIFYGKLFICKSKYNDTVPITSTFINWGKNTLTLISCNMQVVFCS